MDVDSTSRDVADLVAALLNKFPDAQEALRQRLEQEPSLPTSVPSPSRVASRGSAPQAGSRAKSPGRSDLAAAGARRSALTGEAS